MTRAGYTKVKLPDGIETFCYSYISNNVRLQWAIAFAANALGNRDRFT